MNSAVAKLIKPRARVEKVVDADLHFLEGLTWVPDTESLVFNEVPTSKTYEWSPGDPAPKVIHNENGMANGMTLDQRGRLVACRHFDSDVVRWEEDEGWVLLASHFDGRGLNSPNDVIVSPAGEVYFTDPDFGRRPYFGREREPELDFRGVFMVGPRPEEPVLLADDFAGPNGLCFSPDRSILYVNDTLRMHIRRFSLPEGRLAGGEVFVEIPGDPEFSTGVPDGMKCDEDGNVFCTGPGGIWVFDQGGEHLGTIEVPGHPVNFCFGGEDRSDLYIGAFNGKVEPLSDRASIYRLRLAARGAKPPYLA